jgi:hypothetical protein
VAQLGHHKAAPSSIAIHHVLHLSCSEILLLQGKLGKDCNCDRKARWCVERRNGDVIGAEVR